MRKQESMGRNNILASGKNSSTGSPEEHGPSVHAAEAY